MESFIIHVFLLSSVWSLQWCAGILTVLVWLWCPEVSSTELWLSQTQKANFLSVSHLCKDQRWYHFSRISKTSTSHQRAWKRSHILTESSLRVKSTRGVTFMVATWIVAFVNFIQGYQHYRDLSLSLKTRTIVNFAFQILEHSVERSTDVYNVDVSGRWYYQGAVSYSWPIVLLPTPLPWGTVSKAAYLSYHLPSRDWHGSVWKQSRLVGTRKNLTCFRSLSPGICFPQMKDSSKRVKRASKCVEPITHRLSPFQGGQKRSDLLTVCEKNKHVWFPQDH